MICSRFLSINPTGQEGVEQNIQNAKGKKKKKPITLYNTVSGTVTLQK